MKYAIEFTDKAKKGFLLLPVDVRELIFSKLTRIADDPYATNHNIKRLVGVQDRYRLRQGYYRVVYDIIRDRLVLYIIMVDHRRRYIDEDKSISGTRELRVDLADLQ